jgi:hypothetical protein
MTLLLQQTGQRKWANSHRNTTFSGTSGGTFSLEAIGSEDLPRELERATGLEPATLSLGS